MKKSILLISICFTMFNQSEAQSKLTGPAASQRLLRHVVLIKFKEGTSPQDIRKVEDAFRELPSKIKLIKGFEWGTNNSPEKLNEGLTHCFLLSFTSIKDRDDYLVQPAHKNFVSIAKPFFDKVTVVDYWTEK